MHLSVEHIEILLLIAAIVAMLVRRVRLPYTVGLVLAGICVALLPSRLDDAPLSPGSIFTVLLPPLIFEAAYHMNWRRFRREMPVTVTLATFGVVLAVGVVAVGLHLLLHWPWQSAVLLAVLLSPTDPVSVIATFREVNVERRLAMLVESESLLNDGTAAVSFAIVFAGINGQALTGSYLTESFLVIVLGGILCGAVVAGAVLLLAGRTTDHLVEITFTSVAAYGSFLLADHFHVSGVLATLTAGIMVGNLGRLGLISPRGRTAVESFWEYFGFVANSLIFLLIGIALTHQYFRQHLVAVLVVIVLATAGRAVAVYVSCAPFARTRYAVNPAHQHILFWGGLRGALSLALALSLPATCPYRDAIRVITFATVAFSVLVQGVTLMPLLVRLNLIQEAPSTQEQAT